MHEKYFVYSFEQSWSQFHVKAYCAIHNDFPDFILSHFGLFPDII